MVRRKQRFAIGKEWTRGSGKRRLLSFLACVVLIAALVGWIFPVECLGRPAESCPVLFAQDTFVPDHSLDSESQRSTQNDLAVQLFHDTLELIRNNFAGDPPDKQFFDDVLAEIALTMLPHCAESLTRSERCSDSTENCVLEAIRAATARCKLPAAPVILKALKVLLNKLDTNSGLLDPQMLEEVKISTSGTFGGIGLMVAPREGQYVVTGSFDGSPGYRAGIRAGDVVLAIEGEPL